MENHGQELIDKIKAETADWDMSSKRMLPIIVGMIIGDELFSQLGLEDEQIEQARSTLNGYSSEISSRSKSRAPVCPSSLDPLHETAGWRQSLCFNGI